MTQSDTTNPVGFDEEPEPPRRTPLPPLRLFVVSRMNPLFGLNLERDGEALPPIEIIPVEAHTITFDDNVLSFGIFSYEGRGIIGQVKRVFASGEWLDMEEVYMPAPSTLVH